MSVVADELIAALVARTPGATAVDHLTIPWFSATFEGERHEIVLAFENADTAKRFGPGLQEHVFALPGRLVADISAGPPLRCGGHVQVSVEALTIDGS